jgi:hypothetical protein
MFIILFRLFVYTLALVHLFLVVRTLVVLIKVLPIER